jgi:hypothetical protein
MIEVTNKPLYAIFIFFLIISSNYLGEIFPCKIQKVMTENIYVKHIFAFLTLTFFVVLVDPLKSQTLGSTLANSFFLYIIFLLLINTNVVFFLISMGCLAIMYLLKIKQNEPISTPGAKVDIIPSQWMDQTYNALQITFAISTIVGFLVYMGEKKIEYKGKFRYSTFVFGKPSCRGFSPQTKYIDSFIAAFK